jgi:glutamyl/glutaminyl-tRNA synthetase
MATGASQLTHRTPYRGRLAPSPTGYLHLGHARTFWVAQQRAQAADGVLVLRNEDLDPQRSKPEFVHAMFEDLRWFGFDWQEGPDCGGAFAPYSQSERTGLYRAALEKLQAGRFIYPCTCSRKELQRVAQAPHATDEELVYPGTCRPRLGFAVRRPGSEHAVPHATSLHSGPGSPDLKLPKVNWRFRVPDGEAVSFVDGARGLQRFIAGRDFGDFVVWRNDGVPAYQLAVVVDDHAMHITEVVRGADLLLSTARQILVYRALGLTPPDFFHCPLLTDERGMRLAKRHDALSLRAMRASGLSASEIRQNWRTT